MLCVALFLIGKTYFYKIRRFVARKRLEKDETKGNKYDDFHHEQTPHYHSTDNLKTVTYPCFLRFISYYCFCF